MAENNFSEYLTPKNIGIACGAASVLFFILPWLDAFIVHFSGLNLALSGGKMAGSGFLWLIVRILQIAMLLVPVGGGLAGYAAYTEDKSLFNLGMIAVAGGMVISLGFLIIGSLSAGHSMFGLLTIWYFLSWATIGGMYYTTKIWKTA